MTKQISSQLLKTLGMEVWQLSPEFQARWETATKKHAAEKTVVTLKNPEDSLSEESPLAQAEPTVTAESPQEPEIVHPPRLESPFNADVTQLSDTEKNVVASKSVSLSASLDTDASIPNEVLSLEPRPSNKPLRVFIGEGLDAVWQNEETPEGRLLDRILDVMAWADEDVEYYDTANLHSDEAIFTTLDEIIEAGVDTVFSFDEDGELVEQLAEGVTVILLPSLASQLQSGSAKKTCYARLSNYG